MSFDFRTEVGPGGADGGPGGAGGRISVRGVGGPGLDSRRRPTSGLLSSPIHQERGRLPYKP